MAENQSVWGIEIGQAGLKAIRLRYADAAGQVIATAFDYIPHPKLLSQPDAVPEELIREALSTFLSRNQVGNDKLAISLPGSSSLAKFIQLPPVDASKVAEIVKYEARQQIPFPLEDVIWDFQPLGSGMEENGFLMDAEVGLFAMKREQVEQHMAPFVQRKLELELIQIAPLAVYNLLCYDRMGQRVGQDFTAPEDEYTVALDMGCDATTLLVTNGRKIWIRNVSIGGNHFTRALTKDMKLTFAKAEHLKCNATKAPDPKAVFQAMKPVFNDYVTEIQRSIGFFSSVNRQAKITRLVGVGNGFKLAGLQKYLEQNLPFENCEVQRVDHFESLAGDQVISAPLFQENLLTFAVPYGLALQVLGLTIIRTSLLPPEIVVARKIRKKKPWAVATAAAMLLGFSASVMGYGNVAASVSTERFKDAEAAADDLEKYAGKLKSDYGAQEKKFKDENVRGEKLVSTLKTREIWAEFYKALDECLPRDEGAQLDEEKMALMNRMSLKNVTAKKYSNLNNWFEDESQMAKKNKEFMKEDEKEKGPEGEGYVFTLHGVHFHKDPTNLETGEGAGYVAATFLKNLQSEFLERTHPVTGEKTRIDVGRMGISHATLFVNREQEIDFYPNAKPGSSIPGQPGGGGFGAGYPGGNPGGMNPAAMAATMRPRAQPGPNRPGFPGAAPGFPGANPGFPGLDPTTATNELGTPIRLPKTVFKVQFAWKYVPLEERAPYKDAAGEAPVEEPAGK